MQQMNEGFSESILSSDVLIGPTLNFCIMSASCVLILFCNISATIRASATVVFTVRFAALNIEAIFQHVPAISWRLYLKLWVPSLLASPLTTQTLNGPSSAAAETLGPWSSALKGLEKNRGEPPSTGSSTHRAFQKRTVVVFPHRTCNLNVLFIAKL